MRLVLLLPWLLIGVNHLKCLASRAHVSLELDPSDRAALYSQTIGSRKKLTQAPCLLQLMNATRTVGLAQAEIELDPDSSGEAIESRRRRSLLSAYPSISTPAEPIPRKPDCEDGGCDDGTSTIGRSIALTGIEGTPPQRNRMARVAPSLKDLCVAAMAAIISPVRQIAELYVMPLSSHTRSKDLGSPLILALELRIPCTLQDLQKGDRSLSEFLLALHGQLTQAVGVADRQVGILAIHGRYKREQVNRHGPKMDEEVCVRFQVENAGGVPAQKVEHTLKHQLADPGSALRLGPLGSLLSKAIITNSENIGWDNKPLSARRTQVSRLSAMAIPIGISAAFTGILIWLAAW